MTDQKELEQETTHTAESEESTSVDTESTNSANEQTTTEVAEETAETTGEVEIKKEKTETEEATEKPEEVAVSDSDNRSEQSSKRGKRDRRNRDNNRPRRRQEGEKKEFEERMLEVRRVTRVTTGGRQLSFRATILIGNKNGKIGLGVAKGNDVQSAVSKATHDAYRNIVNVTINNNGSVPYPTETKYKSAYIKLIPALPGTGLKAGASVRQVLELAGYTNILSKIVGTNNKLNNALLAISMLKRFKNFGNRFNLKNKQEEPNKAETEK